MQRIPARGIGYGLLRNLGPREAVARLEQLPRPEVHLNYLGQVDQMQADLSLFDRYDEPPQSAPRPPVRTFTDVRMKAQIEGGQLRLRIGYHENRYRRTTIARVAGDVMAALRALLDDDQRQLSVVTEAIQSRENAGSASSRHSGPTAA
jgi:non-ribosomal peptide synthase protein (TIGR01720 family)